MTEIDPLFAQSQLETLERAVPSYDFEGLVLPEGIELAAEFGSHEDKGDMDELRAGLKAADLIVIESFGWLPNIPESLGKVSKGDYKTRTRWLESLQLRGGVQSEWLAQTVTALYDVRKPIIITDIPASDPLTKALKTQMNAPKPKGPFTDALKLTREQKEKYAKLDLARENYMLRSFVEKVGVIIESTPKLKQKQINGEKIRIRTLDFGLTHSGIYEGLQELARRSGSDFSGTISFGRGGFSYHTQIIGRYIRGLEVDDELLAKELVCDLVVRKLFAENPSLSRTEAEYITIHQLDGMSLEELETTYNTMQ